MAAQGKLHVHGRGCGPACYALPWLGWSSGGVQIQPVPYSRQPVQPASKGKTTERVEWLPAGSGAPQQQGVGPGLQGQPAPAKRGVAGLLSVDSASTGPAVSIHSAGDSRRSATLLMSQSQPAGAVTAGAGSPAPEGATPGSKISAGGYTCWQGDMM